MIFQPNLIVHVVEPTSLLLYGTPLPAIPPRATHYIGRFKYPLTTSGSSSVFLAHYPCEDGEPFSGPVKKLTFNQLGSFEAPNLEPYVSTCDVVEFNGYISSARTCFEIVNQLTEVTKVEFFVGNPQHRMYTEENPEHFSKVPVCPHVETLKIVMDLEYFHSFPQFCGCGLTQSQCNKLEHCFDEIQRSLLSFVESVLRLAGESFPNLKNLDVDLPENDRLCNEVESLIIKLSCQKTQATLQNVESPEENTLEKLSMEHQKSTKVRHTARFDIEAENNQQVPMTYPSQPSLDQSSLGNSANVDGMHSEHELISPSSELSSDSSSLSSFQMMNHRPPPGFAPLQLETSGRFTQGSEIGHSEFRETDVEQWVSNWLTTVD